MNKAKKNPYGFVFDVETTGFSPIDNDIIQLAGQVFDLESHEVLATFNQFCKPITPNGWEKGAEAVHGISEAEANTFQDPRKMGIKFLHFIKPFKDENDLPLKMVYHAKGQFDWWFLRSTFRKVKLLNSLYRVFEDNYFQSTVTLADRNKRTTKLPNSKLNTVADYLEVKLDHHEALSDVKASFEAYKFFTNIEAEKKKQMELM